MTDPTGSSDQSATPKHDVRRSVQEDMGVRIERDLTNSSDWLARGSKTHFSKIKFHSVGRSHAEIAASPPAPPLPPEPAGGPATEASAPLAAAAPAPEPPSAPSLFGRIKSLLGLSM